MGPLTILAVAVGLAVDAFAASLARGCAVRPERLFATAFVIAALFGGFQALMPFIGWQVGDGVKSHIAAWDHWIAFGVLAVLGARTIHEGLTAEPGTADDTRRLKLTAWALLAAAVATSIDALAAGFGIALVDADMWALIAVTGAVTFALAWIGVHIGCKVNALLGPRAEVFGGLVLIGIGAHILYRHLTA